MQVSPLQPTEDLLKAIHRLNGNEDFKLLKKYLEDKKENCAYLSCVMPEDIRSRWLQGRVIELNDILAVIDKAKSELEKLQKKKAKK